MIRKHKYVRLLLLLHMKALSAPFFLTLLHLWNRWPAAGDRSDDVLIDLWRGFVIPSQPPPPTYLCAATVVCCQTSPLEAGPSYLWQPIVILHNQAFLNKPSLDALYHLLDTRWCDSFAIVSVFFSLNFLHLGLQEHCSWPWKISPNHTSIAICCQQQSFTI